MSSNSMKANQYSKHKQDRHKRSLHTCETMPLIDYELVRTMALGFFAVGQFTGKKKPNPFFYLQIWTVKPLYKLLKAISSVICLT